MKSIKFICLSLLLFWGLETSAQEMKYYEMRTYMAHEGKRPDLIKRFQDHTLRLFKKAGIENVAYFIPTDPNNNTLTFILAYPHQAMRDMLWDRFANDPEWLEARKASEANGPLVANVVQTFMQVAPDLNPEIIRDTYEGTRVFELRTYTIPPGKIDGINARFRDYTRELFQKHGMINVMYWYTVEDDDSVQPRLIYLLAHKNEKAGKESFAKFAKDPAWITVRDASEQNGPIVQKVESVYLQPLPFSPLK